MESGICPERAEGTGTLSQVTPMTMRVYLVYFQTAVALSGVRREFGQSHLSDRFRKLFSSLCHPENTQRDELRSKTSRALQGLSLFFKGCDLFRVAHVSELQQLYFICLFFSIRQGSQQCDQTKEK